VPIALKYGSLKFLEHSRVVKVRNGFALSFHLVVLKFVKVKYAHKRLTPLPASFFTSVTKVLQRYNAMTLCEESSILLMKRGHILTENDCYRQHKKILTTSPWNINIFHNIHIAKLAAAVYIHFWSSLLSGL